MKVTNPGFNISILAVFWILSSMKSQMIMKKIFVAVSMRTKCAVLTSSILVNQLRTTSVVMMMRSFAMDSAGPRISLAAPSQRLTVL